MGEKLKPIRNYNAQLIEVENSKRGERLDNIAQDEVNFISENFDVQDNLLAERYAAAASVDWQPGTPYLVDYNGQYELRPMEGKSTLALTDAKHTMVSSIGVNRKMAIYHNDEISDHRLSHEILHVLSTEVNTFFGSQNQGYLKNGLHMIGFDSEGQAIDESLNASALSEGVTEVLASKMDKKIDFKNKEYEQFRDIADILIGPHDKQLVKAYFSDNEREFKEFLADFDKRQRYVKSDQLVNLPPDGAIDPKLLHACVAYNMSFFPDKTTIEAQQEYQRISQLADTIDKRSDEILYQQMRKRVNWNALESPEDQLKILRALAPQSDDQPRPNTYQALIEMDVPEKEKEQIAPQWQQMTRSILIHNLQQTYSWFNRHFDDMSQHMQGIADNFREHIKPMLLQGLLRDGNFEDIYNSLDYQQLRAKPIKRQGEHFVHCHQYVTRETQPSEKIQARLYMSPTMENMTPLLQQLVAEYDKRDMSYYFKFSNKGDRNDRLVIYTDYRHINKHLDVLHKISDEHPELFENMSKNYLWGEIKGAPKGVYFGEEPKDTGRESYDGLRSQVIKAAYQRWVKAYGLIGREHEMIVQYEPPREVLLVFRNMILEEAKKLGLGGGTKGFCFNGGE